jgi:hypothetical protein
MNKCCTTNSQVLKEVCIPSTMTETTTLRFYRCNICNSTYWDGTQGQACINCSNKELDFDGTLMCGLEDIVVEEDYLCDSYLEQGTHRL